MNPPDVVLTDTHMWKSTIFAGPLAVLLMLLLVYLVKETLFQRLSKALAITAGLFWCLLYTSMGWWAWDWCYSFLFPGWVYWVIPVYGILIGPLALGLWWLAKRIPGNPVLIFLLLGGLQSLPGHLHGIYGRGLLEKCPLLRQVSPASALVFGVFEFIIYWSVVLILAVLLTLGWQKAKTLLTRPGLWIKIRDIHQ